jgi:restriction system protein
MDIFSIVKPFLTNFWWLIVIALVLPLFRTPWFKGIFGEFLVRLSARFMLDKNLYHPFHSVMLATPDGTTQIDHIFVSKFGVFVAETKNMKGWIFGDPAQESWTQQIFKSKYKFQNPLRQNYKHTKALEALLSIPESAIHSVIIFVGESTFKTVMPENVTYAGGFIRYIKSKTQVVLTDSQVQTAISAIKSGKLKATFQAQLEHVRNLQSRSNPDSEQLCPKCGSPMVLRTAKKGGNQGNQFWGCSQYPKCHTIRSVT